MGAVRGHPRPEESQSIMSLVSELADRQSPIREYVRFAGTIVADSGVGLMAAEFKKFLGLDALPKSLVVEPVGTTNLPMVGTAFDYRLRYHLAPCDPQTFVAAYGAGRLGMMDPLTVTPLKRFFSNLEELTAELLPAGQQLDEPSERLLDSYCVVLAQLESIYRTAGGWTPELPMKRPRLNRPEYEPLLALAPDSVVQDVMNLSRSAGTTFRPLIETVTTATVPYFANPTFAGSLDIGGADADFIIGDVIFELKTTKKLDASAIRDALLQLIGYCLLDYDDRHAVRKAAVYFPRQEWVSGWPLWTLVFPPADVILRTVNDKEPTDDEVTERLAKLRVLMERVVKGDTIDYEAVFS